MKNLLSLLVTSAAMLFDSVNGMDSIKSSEKKSTSQFDSVDGMNSTKSRNKKRRFKFRQILIDIPTETPEAVKEKYQVSEIYKFVNSSYESETNLKECVDFYEKFNTNPFVQFLVCKEVLLPSSAITVRQPGAIIQCTRHFKSVNSINQKEMSDLVCKFCKQHALFFKLMIRGYTKEEAEAEGNGFLKWFDSRGRSGLGYDDGLEAWRQFYTFYDSYKNNWYSPYLEDDPALPYPPK